MRKAYLHIGMPKTGTTAIQESLSRSRKALKAHGIIYPGDDVDHSALLPAFHQSGPNHYLYKISGIPPEGASLIARNLLRAIELAADGFDGDFLMSSEYMHNVNRVGLRKLDRFFAKLGFDLRIICYVRHPYAQASSSTQQNVKMGQGDLAEMIAKPRWHSLIESIKPSLLELGRDRVIVRTYDEARIVSAEQDILTAVGYEGPRQEIEAVSINESLSMAGVLLADAHYRLEREGRLSTDCNRGYLFRLRGPKFTLPASSLRAMRPQAKKEVDWLRDNLGIELVEPQIASPGEGSFSSAVAEDLVMLITGSSAGTTLPKDRSPLSEKE